MALSSHADRIAETMIGRGARVSQILKFVVHLEDMEQQKQNEPGRVYRQDAPTVAPRK